MYYMYFHYTVCGSNTNVDNMEVRILQPTMSSSKMVDSDILSGKFALHPLCMTSSGAGN